MSVVYAATWHHVNAHGLCCHWRPCLGPWFYYSQSLCWCSELSYHQCILNRHHAGVYWLCCHLKQCWCPGMCWSEGPVLSPEAMVMPRPMFPMMATQMFMVCDANWNHIKICKVPGTILMLLTCPASLGYVDVRDPGNFWGFVHEPTAARDHVPGLCCYQETCGGSWSKLLMIVNSRQATFAVIWMTADAQVRGRDMEGFCDSPYSHPNLPPPPKVTG